jgi:hypothetical protein
MPTNFIDLNADVNVYELQVVLGVPSVDASSGYQNAVIPYTGIGNPSDSNVSISRAWYSTDDGATWDVMTEVGSSTGLTFSTGGTAHQFVWAARTDLGADIYNTLIKISFKATGTSGDSLPASRNVLFTRTVTDQSAAVTASAVQLPDDYSGVFGNELLINAPKS